MPDILCFICASKDYDPTKTGSIFLRRCPRYARRKKSIGSSYKPRQLKTASC